MRALIDETVDDLVITQDLGLGMMLWLAHFFPEEDWAQAAKSALALRCSTGCGKRQGYFAREPICRMSASPSPITVSRSGCRRSTPWPERVDALNAYFETYRSGDEYDRTAITHVMACSSHFPGLLLRS